MNTNGMAAFLDETKATLSKHRPAILMGIGITGMVTTTILAVRATPKAIIAIEDEKIELDKDKLTPIEAAKVCWKYYIPATATMLAATTCLIFSHTESTRRATAMAAAYQLSEAALNEYKDAVIETIGEKKEKAVRSKMTENSLKKNPVDEEFVHNTGYGNTLCHDAVFGSYFRSSHTAVERAIVEINRRIVSGDMYASLNDFYDELGIPHIDIGDYVGWNLDDGEIKVHDDYGGSHTGEPTLVIRYNVYPKYDFYKFT